MRPLPTRRTGGLSGGTQPPFPHAPSLAIAAGCALFVVVIVLSGWATARQAVPWAVLVLLAGLWLVPSMPLLFPALLALLLLCLFDVVPPAQLIGAASGNAALWLLGSLVLSLAAKDSGLLGALMARSAGTRNAGATRAVPAVLWLSAALALLPSPDQASRWSASFCAASNLSRRASAEVLRAARVLARLAWLPAHPVNLVAIGLLPGGGLDRFIATHWLLQTWPLLLLAMMHGAAAQWWSGRMTPAVTKNAGSCALETASEQDLFALRCVAGIGLGVVLMTVLEPYHGLAPGLLALFGLVVLFALQLVPAGRFHPAIDWNILVAVGLLPGLVSTLATELPLAVPSVSFAPLALPALLVLRAFCPALPAVALLFVVLLPWSAAVNADLADAVLPVLVALHIAEMVLVRPGADEGPAGLGALAQAMTRPSAWLWVGAYYLWLGWSAL
ncbi:MAG: hypothetical protein ABWY08_04490 [Comamonas sp.]